MIPGAAAEATRFACDGGPGERGVGAARDSACGADIFERPEFRGTVERIRRSCLDAGVPFGQLGVPLPAVEEIVERGTQLLNVGSDVGAVRDARGALRGPRR